MADPRDKTDDEALLHDVLSAVPAFVVRVGTDFKVSYVNRLLPQLSMDDVIGTTFTEFVQPAYRELAARVAREVLSTGQPGRYSSEGVGPNGQVSHYDVRVVPIDEPNGAREFCMIATDVTEQVVRERALEASRERLAVAVETTGIGLWTWDVVANEHDWSDRMYAITGLSEPIDIDRYIHELVHPDDRAMVGEAVARTMATGSWDSMPHRIVRPDGEVRWVNVFGHVTMGDSGAAVRVAGSLVDLTEQIHLKSELRQAQKMQAIGNVTAGIAHNFNNMLMVICPALEMLCAGTITPGNKIVGHARHAAERAADMVAQLMTFAGQRPAERREAHRLHSLTERAIDSARVADAVEVSFEPTAVNVHCDDGAIEQVLVNVLANARDALLETDSPAPRIHVAIDVIEPGSGRPEAAAGRYARVSIADNGPGMSESVRQQIFEPFFTTKGVKRGTGLGLATSYAIVREHGGWIECTSAPGDGARFDIYLPVTERKPRATSPREDEAANLRVLLVDDEPSLGLVLRQTLLPEGFQLAAATRAAEALELLERDPDFAVILLDRSMPGARSSRDLVRQLRERCTAPILYFTGQDVPDAELEEVDGVVQKPVMTADLVAALRRAAGAAV